MSEFDDVPVEGVRATVEYDGTICFQYDDYSGWDRSIEAEITFTIEEIEKILEIAKEKKKEYILYTIARGC